MKGSGIKLKTGSFQKYSSKQKNTEQSGVDFLYCNGRQMQIWVGFLRPECPLLHGVVEVVFTQWEPSPALCSTSRPGDQRREEKPTSGGLTGNSIKNCGTNKLFKSASWQAKKRTNSEVGQIWVRLHISLSLDKLFISRGSLSSPIKLGYFWGM